jgi:predicted ATP-grasp superfamily ATP-dependent carboligase
MAHLRWHLDPTALHRPVLLAAFEGWNDAGESATTAVRFLARSLGAERLATIDAEEFYDFTVARPHVRLDQGPSGPQSGEDGLTRKIDWPDPVVDIARLPNGRDVVLLTGIEPALRWRTFTAEVVGLATRLRVEMAMTLGALLADVPHTRPVRVTGTATDPALVAELGFTRSRYEGPTGILSILLAGCQEVGIRAASLWATTPHYLRETQSPKAALALVERVSQMLDFTVDLTELELATVAYERQVDDMLAGEDDVADYVRRLEEDGIEEADDTFEIPSQEELASEVERFLRDQRGGGS